MVVVFVVVVGRIAYFYLTFSTTFVSYIKKGAPDGDEEDKAKKRKEKKRKV